MQDNGILECVHTVIKICSFVFIMLRFAVTVCHGSIVSISVCEPFANVVPLENSCCGCPLGFMRFGGEHIFRHSCTRRETFKGIVRVLRRGDCEKKDGSGWETIVLKKASISSTS